jgi:broad specificity phosphatase PhoE
VQLFLVRHGESEANRIGEEAGADSSLTDLGMQQAERLGQFLQPRGPYDAFYCSTLQRAIQTAQIVARYVEAPAPVFLDDLREATFHMIDILPRYEHPLDVVRGRPASPLPAEYHQFRQQIAAAIETIVQTSLDQGKTKVLVVAHGATLGTLVRTLTGAHTISLWSQNCCVHGLVWTDSRWEIRYLNRIEHLEGLMTKR